jgi:hypothetical protein
MGSSGRSCVSMAVRWRCSTWDSLGGLPPLVRIGRWMPNNGRCTVSVYGRGRFVRACSAATPRCSPPPRAVAPRRRACRTRPRTRCGTPLPVSTVAAPPADAAAEMITNGALAVPTPLLAVDSMLLPKRRLGQADGLQMCRWRVADVRQRPFRGRAAASDAARKHRRVRNPTQATGGEIADPHRYLPRIRRSERRHVTRARRSLPSSGARRDGWRWRQRPGRPPNWLPWRCRYSAKAASCALLEAFP